MVSRLKLSARKWTSVLHIWQGYSLNSSQGSFPTEKKSYWNADICKIVMQVDNSTLDAVFGRPLVGSSVATYTSKRLEHSINGPFVIKYLQFQKIAIYSLFIVSRSFLFYVILSLISFLRKYN